MLKRNQRPHTGVIKVYAAYKCGTSRTPYVRLQITSTTTSSEVVALVVEQLSNVSSISGKSPSLIVDPDDFCLAAVVGSRERQLRDDFPPLQLQNPWSNGRLFVRRRDSILAALLFGNEAAV